MGAIINLAARLSGVGKVWAFLDGKKTYGAAALGILTSLAGLGAELAPILASHDTAALFRFVQGLPSDSSWLTLVASVGLLGLGHKAVKAAAVVGAFILIGAIPVRASVYVGKLDLTSDPQAIVLRELHDGMWLVGAQKNLWTLERNGSEVLHVAGFVATRLEGQQPAYGPAVGVPIGPALAALTERIALVSAASDAAPPFLKKLGQWASLDAYGGYRPQITPNSESHHWIYGGGGKVRIPISGVSLWAKGTGDQKGL